MLPAALQLLTLWVSPGQWVESRKNSEKKNRGMLEGLRVHQFSLLGNTLCLGPGKGYG